MTTITGRMDRYVAKAVLSAYLAAMVFLIFMVVVIEMLMEMDHFVVAAEKNKEGVFGLMWLVFQYQALSVPYIFVTIAPFVTVIAAMFALSRLMSANEVVPMIFTGRSMLRVMRPMLAVGLLSALLMVIMWQTVVPFCAPIRHSLRARLGGDDASITLKPGIVWSKDKSVILYCGVYKHGLQRMEDVIVLKEGVGVEDELYTEARVALWHPERGDWELIDGRSKRGDVYRPKAWLGMLELTPDRLWQSGKEEREAGEVSYTDLLASMRAHPQRRSYVLALHHHLTFPLANIVLLLLALPFAVHFERRGRIERVVMAIAICAGYLIVDLTCQNLGQNYYLHPVVASWVPTILFGSLGVVVFGGVRS